MSLEEVYSTALYGGVSRRSTVEILELSLKSPRSHSKATIQYCTVQLYRRVHSGTYSQGVLR